MTRPPPAASVAHMRTLRILAVTGMLALPLIAAGPAQAAVQASVTNGVLTVTDSATGAQNNSIDVICTSALVRVSINGGEPFPLGSCASVTGIDISMGTGSDTVNLSALSPANMPNVNTAFVGLGGVGFDVEWPDTNNVFVGGALSEHVSVGTSASSVTTGAGDDTITIGELQFFAGSVTTLDGGPGRDTIRAVHTAPGTTSLTPTSLVRPSGTTNFSGIEAAEVRASTTGSSARTFDASAFPGPTTLLGGNGDDTLIAGPDGGILDGGEGNDTLHFSTGIDDLRGGPGIDTVSGTFAGEMTLSDTALGPDTIDSIEVAELSGSSGDDNLTVTTFTGAVDLDGGGGVDTVDVTATGPAPTTTTATSFTADAAAVTRPGADLISMFAVERVHLRGGTGTDTLDTTAFSGLATLSGGDGDDTLALGPGGGTIDAGPGNDTLRPGPAAETLIGGPGTDTLLGDRGTTFGAVTLTPTALTVGGTVHALDGIETANLAGSPAADTFDATAFPGPVVIDAGAGDDRVRTGPGPDVLLGGPGNDDLDGGAGADVIDGGLGNDFVHGGPGGPGDGDTLLGGPGFDMVTYAARTTPVRVTLDGVADDGSAGENDQADLSLEGVIGGTADDVIVLQQSAATRSVRSVRGGPGAGFAYGGAGNDQITGTPLADVIGGGPGNDTVTSGAGNDAVHGGSGNDIIKAGPGNDRTYGERGVDQIDLGAGDDVAFSLDRSKDTVNCGEGTDQAYSGIGDVVRATCTRVAAIRITRRPSAAGAKEDGTDNTLEDGDGFFGTDGDTPPDENGDGETFLTGDFAEEWGFTDIGFGDFDDFGAEFDDDFFGEGFDDFGDAFGDDLGGKQPPTPRVTTTALRLQKSRYAVRLSCPKKADRRCIGEITITLRTKGKSRRVGRTTFGVNAGKATTVRPRVTPASRTAIRKAKAKRLEVTFEGRDRGDAAWQGTKQIRIAAAKKAASKKKKATSKKRT
jgi:Ca2+-binding RTX toxin-like protein